MVVRRRGDRGRRKGAGLSTVRSELQARRPAQQPLSEGGDGAQQDEEPAPALSWEHLGACSGGALLGEQGGAAEQLQSVLGHAEALHEPIGQDALLFEVLFYLYLVAHLLLQNFNIYKANIYNYNVSLLLLTMMTLCKRIMVKYLSSTRGVAVQVARGTHTAVTLALIAAVTINSVFFITQLFLAHPLVNFLFLFYPSLLSVCIFGVGDGGERRGTGRALVRRIYRLLYSAMEYAYYVGVLPLRFLQHDYLYYDLARCMLLVAFVFANALVMLLAHMLRTSFIDLYMQARALGRWEPYLPEDEEEKPKESVREWSAQYGPYRRGAVVTHQGGFFVAKYAQNTIQPGRILLPALLYILFKNPSRTHLALIGAQGVVVTVQLGLLLSSNHWTVYGVMLAFSYAVMYYCIHTWRKNLLLFRHYGFDEHGGVLPEAWPKPGHYCGRLLQAGALPAKGARPAG